MFKLMESDTILLSWLEDVRGQLWYNRYNKNWTCQVIVHHHVIQPSRAMLRAALTDAKAEYLKLKI